MTCETVTKRIEIHVGRTYLSITVARRDVRRPPREAGVSNWHSAARCIPPS
jgi:hypothetical protein